MTNQNKNSDCLSWIALRVFATVVRILLRPPRSARMQPGLTSASAPFAPPCTALINGITTDDLTRPLSQLRKFYYVFCIMSTSGCHSLGFLTKTWQTGIMLHRVQASNRKLICPDSCSHVSGLCSLLRKSGSLASSPIHGLISSLLIFYH